jgi:hypothetical protein
LLLVANTPLKDNMDWILESGVLEMSVGDAVLFIAFTVRPRLERNIIDPSE